MSSFYDVYMKIVENSENFINQITLNFSSFEYFCCILILNCFIYQIKMYIKIYIFENEN